MSRRRMNWSEPPGGGQGVDGVTSPSRRGLARRVGGEVRPFWGHLMLLFLLDLLATPLYLLVPIPVKIAVDSVVGSDPLPEFIDFVMPDSLTASDSSLLVTVAVMQVLVVLLIQLQELGRYVLSTYTGERLTLGLRTRLFRHLQRLSLAFHDLRGTADSVYRVQYDAPALQYIAVDGIVPLVTSGVMFVAMIFVIALLDWQLAVVALAISPLLVYYSRAFSGRMRPRYRNLKGVETDAMSVVQEVLSGLRVVKAFGREEREQERFSRQSTEGAQARIRLSFAEGALGLFVNVTTAIGTAAVLFIGIRGVQARTLTIGEFLVVVAYLAQLYSPLRMINRTFATIQKSWVGAERVFEIMDELPDVADYPDGLSLGRSLGELEFKRASFSYDGKVEVLKDVSFSIGPGTRLGVVGKTGSGKTTLISLVTRFYDPTEGSILLDGVDLRAYRLADLRGQFAIVLQEPLLFSTTISENIAYARPEAREEDIVEAARAANAHEFILSLPDRYETVVGERGMRLSGGERQRISLARAFLKNAPILILDEPTSAVDIKTEKSIIDAMERLMSGRTTIMIAHRVSTLNKCDVMLELDDGRVASFGKRAIDLTEGTGFAETIPFLSDVKNR